MYYLKLVLAAMVVGVTVVPASAQNSIRWSGLFYMDYEYLLASSDKEAEGENGFDYRRLYLTADYTLSDEFSGRARMEAASEPVSSSPFIKDLYLKWKGVLGKGHDLVFGVQSPPVFNLSEKLWGYRSLEKTIMDRQKIVSSRDMGVAANGKVTSDGKVTYGLMVANNNSVRGESDKYKRVYGQLAWQSGKFAASAGGDFAAGDDRNAINTNVFAGYKTADVGLGVEGYLQQIDFDHSDANTDKMGISLWIVKPVNEKVEVVGRVDHVENETGSSTVKETYLIGGVAFSPNPDVHLIPNVFVVDKSGQNDPEIAGRVTLHVDFK